MYKLHSESRFPYFGMQYLGISMIFTNDDIVSVLGPHSISLLFSPWDMRQYSGFQICFLGTEFFPQAHSYPEFQICTRAARGATECEGRQGVLPAWPAHSPSRAPLAPWRSSIERSEALAVALLSSLCQGTQTSLFPPP